MRVDFYRLTGLPLFQALPVLAEKAYASGKKIFILAPSDAEAQTLDRELWTYKTDSFLPHDVAGGEYDAKQPILIGCDMAHAAEAAIVFAVGSPPENVGEKCERLLFMFSGDDLEALKAARLYWKSCDKNGAEKHFWNREESGRWVEKEL